MSSSSPHWFLAGAGNMGTLAAFYVRSAGQNLTVLRRDDTAPLTKRLAFADGRAARRLSLAVRNPARVSAPVRHLIVACKTPYTEAALAGLPLAADATVLRLQNGLGSLDGHLPATATLIEVVTTTAVKGRHPEHLLVAENDTWMGGAQAPPPWFATLAHHWPGLSWSDAIGERQWHKLVANAVINPLTALHDVANGRLLEDPALAAQAQRLAEEADLVLHRLDPHWPGHSLARVREVMRATAGNTSSMRADTQRGAVTEIDAINGWLLRQAQALGLALPAHREIVAAIRARHPAGG